MEQFTPEFWVAVGQIIMTTSCSGGDNAVVIALACRKRPRTSAPRHFVGTAGAIVLRVVLIYFALTLLAIPFLKLVGAALLVGLASSPGPDPDDAHGNIDASDKLLAAIKTIIIVADLVMSIDNASPSPVQPRARPTTSEMPLVILA